MDIEFKPAQPSLEKMAQICVRVYQRGLVPALKEDGRNPHIISLGDPDPRAAGVQKAHKEAVRRLRRSGVTLFELKLWGEKNGVGPFRPREFRGCVFELSDEEKRAIVYKIRKTKLCLVDAAACYGVTIGLYQTWLTRYCPELRRKTRSPKAITDNDRRKKVLEIVGAGTADADISRRHGIAPSTFHRWMDELFPAGVTEEDLAGILDPATAADRISAQTVRLRREISKLQMKVFTLSRREAELRYQSRRAGT